MLATLLAVFFDIWTSVFIVNMKIQELILLFRFTEINRIYLKFQVLLKRKLSIVYVKHTCYFYVFLLRMFFFSSVELRINVFAKIVLFF